MTVDRCDQRREQGFLRYGCVGCLVLLVLPVIAVLALALVGLAISRGEPRLESTTLSRLLPGGDRAGIIFLNVSRIALKVEAGKAGTPVRVEGIYDGRFHILSQVFDDDGDRWVHRIDFGLKRKWLPPLLGDNARNDLRVIIPRDVAFSLAGTIGFGTSDVDLGGLRLIDADVRFRAGDHTVRFSEALPAPAVSLRFESTFGMFGVHRLGNASPGRIAITHRAGPLTLDLNGSWRNDAVVEGRLGFGEFAVVMPPDTTVRVDRAEVRFGSASIETVQEDESLRAGRPTIRLSVRQVAGRLRGAR